VTTIDAAAAWRVRKTVTSAVFAAFVGLGLGGCETAGSLFPTLSSDSSAPVAGAPQTAVAQIPKIAIAPIIGAPDTVAKQLQTQLTTAIEMQKITVARPPNDKGELTLRGYIVSAKEKTKTKVSYIWDVTDQSGKRVHRITGEEVVAGAQGKDPWASVTPQIVDTIANKTTASLTTWLPTQSQPAVAAIPTPGAQASASSSSGTQANAAMSAGAVAPSSPPAAAITAPTAPAAPAPGPTTGSINRDTAVAAVSSAGGTNAMVPSVTGAPGDGSVALTSALQRELARSGITLADKASAQTYRVEGKVAVGEAKEGKQQIQIDWNVKDPQGKKLGTVSQKNEIPQGSLDGAWGKTADAAAAAAAQGILKLLPPATKTN
jgi:hypothetical protein